MNRFILVFVTVVFATVYSAAQSRAGDKGTAGCRPGNLQESTPSLIGDMGRFLADLKTAVAKGDKQRVARMVHYPLAFSTADAGSTIRSENEFIEKYDQILPIPLRDLLQRQETRCISRVGAKGFTIGTGEVWFDKFQDGTVKIIGITSVVYPGE
jgi:hypothetical protein